jgi:hypothetical protein
VAESGTAQLRKDSSAPPTRFAGLRGGPAKPAASPMPHGDLTAAGAEQIQQVVRAVWPGGPDAVRRRARGARFLLEHLTGFPGSAWQQRWEASGLNERGRPVTAVRGKQAERDEICVGTACLFSLRVIRPSLQALRSTRFLRYGERFLTAQNDSLLEEFWKRVQNTTVHPLHHGSALFDTTAALTTQGVALADLTPEAFLHYVWESRDHGLAFKDRGDNGRGQFPGQLAWQLLHDMGHFPSGTPGTLRAAVLSGRRTVKELVDRYNIRHQGVRQLLLDYLRRREPEMDYSTLDQLSRSLAGLFWAKIEAPAPGQPDLRIGTDLYKRWREALGTHQDGRKKREEFEHILRSVRSFYTDLHSWAVEEPEKWAHWVAPCPVPDGALRGIILRQRRRKERMDDRVRQRQPLLPVLVAHLEDRYHHLRALLQTASPVANGEMVTVNGQAYQRVWTAADDRRARRGGQANTRVRALATGKDINVTTTEDLAFWEFAAVEVLRHAGIRIEELLELTHLSIRQYQRPNGEVIALLVVAPSKTDRERVIPID